MITTKYDIGYKYFAPRYYFRYGDPISKTFEGHVWTRRDFRYEIVIKERTISKIEIHIQPNGMGGSEIIVRYKFDDGLRYCNDSDLEFYTYESAKIFIEKWKEEHPDEEYFG
jgi:hypothetical protein